MSTSELRRGPGWWMDLDGQWNPPEEWPEASPPLPGWTRRPDGMWSEPVEGAEPADDLMPSEEASTIDAPMESTTRPVPDIKPHTVPPLQSLTAPAIFGGELDVEHPAHHDVAGTRATNKVGLSFSDSTSVLPSIDDDRERKRALNAAFVAAITASMFAAGLILLLLLL